jgi:hypothetical protein
MTYSTGPLVPKQPEKPPAQKSPPEGKPPTVRQASVGLAVLSVVSLMRRHSASVATKMRLTSA